MPTFELEIASPDKAFLAEIFNEEVIADARPIPLGDGVELRGVRWGFNKGLSAADVATLILSFPIGLAASLVANLLTGWLRTRRRSIERMTFERTEVKLDDADRVREIITTRITDETES